MFPFKKQEPTNQEPTNKFYETLKEKAVVAAGGTFARMDELREQILKAKTKLSHEVEEAEKWRKRIAKLKNIAGEKILESQTSYEKFKVELRKLHGRVEVSDEIIVALRDDFIPKLKRDYDKVHLEFMERLTGVAKLLRYIGVAATEAKAKEVMKHFESQISEQLSYVSAWERIYKEYGEEFLGMYGASFTLPEILPRLITSENISYVQKLFEPERASLNHPLQTAPVEPIIETPVEKPIETPVDEKPVDEPVDETPVEEKRKKSICIGELQGSKIDKNIKTEIEV